MNVEITCRNVTGLHYFDSIPDIFPGNDVGISPILKKKAKNGRESPLSQLIRSMKIAIPEVFEHHKRKSQIIEWEIILNVTL
jgi:hypothetical protein